MNNGDIKYICVYIYKFFIAQYIYMNEHIVNYLFVLLKKINYSVCCQKRIGLENNLSLSAYLYVMRNSEMFFSRIILSLTSLLAARR